MALATLHAGAEAEEEVGVEGRVLDGVWAIRDIRSETAQ